MVSSSKVTPEFYLNTPSREKNDIDYQPHDDEYYTPKRMQLAEQRKTPKQDT